MSHIVTIEAKYKNINTIKEVCKKLGLECEFTQDMRYGIKGENGYKIKLAQYAYAFIRQNGDILYDDMNIEFLAKNEFRKFKDTYCLIETERLLQKQHLKYKVFENNDEIKIEVTA